MLYGALAIQDLHTPGVFKSLPKEIIRSTGRKHLAKSRFVNVNAGIADCSIIWTHLLGRQLTKAGNHCECYFNRYN